MKSHSDIKICLGCGHIQGDPLKYGNMACCPDNHHLPLRQYLKRSNQDYINLAKQVARKNPNVCIHCGEIEGAEIGPTKCKHKFEPLPTFIKDWRSRFFALYEMADLLKSFGIIFNQKPGK